MNRRHLRQASRGENVGDVELSTGQPFNESAPTASERSTSVHSNARDIPDSDGIPAFAGSNDSTSYGSASMVTFYRQIASSDPSSATRQPLPLDTKPPKVAGSGSSRHLALLPQRSSADDFVFCFFEYFQPVFPVLNRPDFEREYEGLWNSSSRNEDATLTTGQDEAAFVAVVNLVFAIGSRISSFLGPEEKQIVPEDFYQRARNLYRYDLLASSSLRALQMILLIALYLQATQHAVECWNSLGLAIRVAQSLGLHADSGKDRTSSQTQLHLRRQVWHLCVQLDR